VGAVFLAMVVITLDLPVPVAVVLVVALLLAGGALARRAWVPAVPLVAAALYCLWFFLLHGSDISDTAHDASWGLLAVSTIFVATLAAVGLAFGVALRWTIDGRAERRRGRSQDPVRRRVATR